MIGQKQVSWSTQGRLHKQGQDLRQGGLAQARGLPAGGHGLSSDLEQW